MPLNDHPLPLAASARAVADARHWVARACREIGREDLIEAAELGTSELVTNALLHADPPFAVQMRGTPEHPRVEVSDGSPKPPVPPGSGPLGLEPFGDLGDDPALDALDLDALLNTFGRGLGMVAMASVAWGASLETDSKVVWFEPAAEINEDSGPEPIILEPAAPARPPGPPAESRPVYLHGIDPVLFTAQRRQYANLRRELRLLSLAHEEEYPLARDLGEMFVAFEQHFPARLFTEIEAPDLHGDGYRDLVLQLSPDAAAVSATMLEMFELADAFCRAQRLLSLARTQEVHEFQTWFLGQVVDQLSGAVPRPWSTGNGTAAAHVG